MRSSGAGPKGVRCNGVMPGLVMGETQFAQVPTTRLGRPSDLAAVIAFLLSDDAEWTNRSSPIRALVEGK